MSFLNPFLDLALLILFQIPHKRKWIWAPLENPVGAKMGPQIAQVAPKTLENNILGITKSSYWKQPATQIAFWIPLIALGSNLVP